MKLKRPGMLAVSALLCALAVAAVARVNSDGKPFSPIYGVTIPDDYRQWQLIAPAQEAAPLDELRAVLGNAAAIGAYRNGTLPFPDGTVLVKLAWKHVQSPEFEPASIPGAATTVQVMVWPVKWLWWASRLPLSSREAFAPISQALRLCCSREVAGRFAP